MTQILQLETGPLSGEYYLPSSPGNLLWGRLPSAEDRPVLTVPTGAIVTIDTLSHEGLMGDQGHNPEDYFGSHGVDRSDVLDDAIALARSEVTRNPDRDGPHVVLGPIEVTGARPGDLLKITVLEAIPRVGYGVISNRHGRGVLPEYPRGVGNVSVFARVEQNEHGDYFGVLPASPHVARSVRFPMNPFLGIMGVAQPGGERPHSVPPGAHGGNLDINMLTVGSSLYLPVQVPGALAYVGDPHFAQGDGLVALTALEGSLRVTLKFEVLSAAEAIRQFGELTGPLAETDEFLVPTGLGDDLDEALRQCTRAAIALLQSRYGMSAEHAYAYLSAATDFNISQVVDQVKGVHARIRKNDLTAVLQ